MFAVVILAFVAYANANAIGQVVDVAKQAAPVGSHGPALVNIHGGYGGYGGYGGWNNGWGNGWGNGWNNGWGNGWGNGWNNGWAGPIGIGGHGLPSLKVDNWGGHGDAHGHDG